MNWLFSRFQYFSMDLCRVVFALGGFLRWFRHVRWRHQAVQRVQFISNLSLLVWWDSADTSKSCLNHVITDCEFRNFYFFLGKHPRHSCWWKEFSKKWNYSKLWIQKWAEIRVTWVKQTFFLFESLPTNTTHITIFTWLIRKCVFE